MGKRFASEDNVTLYFLQNGVELTANITAAPAQGGKTTIQYSTSMVDEQFPLPDDAAEITYDWMPLKARFTTTCDMESTAQFFREEMQKLGWTKFEKLGGASAEETSLFFDRGGETLLFVLLRAKDGRVHVKLGTLSREAADTADHVNEAMKSETPIESELVIVALPPLPADARNVVNSAAGNEVTFATRESVQNVCKALRRELTRLGWTEQQDFAHVEPQAALLRFEKRDRPIIVTAFDAGISAGPHVSLSASGFRWGEAEAGE